jgi:hypothetical protein
MMKHSKRILIAALAAVVLSFGWRAWQQGAPKREALATVRELAAALSDPASAERALRLLGLPQAMRERTPSEQVEFIRKALQDEITDEGVSVLQRNGQFGPLKSLFPQQAEVWAAQAGAQPADCVAFKLEQDGVCAEVVLAKQPALSTPPSALAYRIVRLNNVKQLAAPKEASASHRP